MPLNGAPLLLRSLKTFDSIKAVNACYPKPAFAKVKARRRVEILIIARRDIARIKRITAAEKIKKNKVVISGGKTRQESVFKALRFLERQKCKPQILIIHNAANPFMTAEETIGALKMLASNKTLAGVAVGRPVENTIKERGVALKTLERRNLWEAGTPQIVRYKPFMEVHKKARRAKIRTTDDISLLEWGGYETGLFPASENNFKITTMRDYRFAQFLARDFSMLKFGYGEDSHAFSQIKRGLHLGGLYLKNLPKLEADSDGDVVLHAVGAALLQAINKGSFGKFAGPLFKKCKIYSSRKCAALILRKIRAQNLKIQKINIVIEGARPKIDPLAPKIKKSLGAVLKIPEEAISISAHTGEDLTAFGKGKGLRCSAAVMCA